MKIREPLAKRQALPANAESLWYLDYHAFWLARLECLYGRATGHALRATPGAAAATAALDLGQSELNRFLRPLNPRWQGNESAIIRNLRPADSDLTLP